MYWLWTAVDVPRIHNWAGGKINLLADTANHADSVTFDEWLNVMNATSGILLLFLVPIVVASFIALAQHPVLAFRSKRPINVHTLPGLVSGFAPSVMPVLAMASGPDGLMNDPAPANVWALKPEDFTTQHQLVQRKTLDRTAAAEVFTAQLGKTMCNVTNWHPYERALLAVFGLQVFLNDRAAASRLLDDLNRSCVVRRFLRRKRVSPVPLFPLANAAFERVVQVPGVNEWLAGHGYVRSALVGLYARDLRLPPARFRWLKGVDRTLWYGLHSADTAKVFVEGAGIAAQARAEVRASKLGLPRPGIMVEQAVEGLQADLESLGLVYPYTPVVISRRQAAEQSVMSAVYAITDPPDSEEATAP
ncbi:MULTISPECIES: secretion/conjugation apparatus DotM-related subunit [Serratia]|uniref:secretion/conjugation apparatus DotM-related subunit n=1 Tax=Serratia TaxID=613 RepID=UPI002550CB66|nr:MULTISPECIES: conjugal transfer protein [Serratia]MCW7566384.1 conjugal transfer protein [Serratia marcescens]MCW7571378.1 conjugal transfer protein [Serratia marcescens]MCW7576379.1 conjugal transfer protein [Serratia marcescens]MCW7581379.1 conjugal transfer protein [Serratia marcescens]MCW7586387.1 conjugal transfer protein [Serratia marcescens]